MIIRKWRNDGEIKFMEGKNKWIKTKIQETDEKNEEKKERREKNEKETRIRKVDVEEGWESETGRMMTKLGK